MILSIMEVSLIQNPSKGNRCLGFLQLHGLSYPYSSDVGGSFVEYLQQARLLIDKNILFLCYIENNSICKNLRWMLEGFAIRSWPAVKYTTGGQYTECIRLINITMDHTETRFDIWKTTKLFHRSHIILHCHLQYMCDSVFHIFLELGITTIFKFSALLILFLFSFD